MNKNLRKELKQFYEAPKPLHKRAFFREMPMRPLHTWYIFWMQVRYISKWEWALSMAFLGIALIMSRYFDILALSVMIAMMPVLAASTVSESMRSVTYGMKELEMSARFSLKSIVLARMVVLGAVNLCLAVVFSILMQGEVLTSILILLVPYLFTAYAGLWVIRKIPGTEGIYFCMGISAAVSLFLIYFSLKKHISMTQDEFRPFWLAAVFILFCMNWKQGKKIIQQMDGSF